MEGIHRHTVVILLFTLLFLGVSITNGERNGRCPPLRRWGICPEGSLSCTEDNDCNEDTKCCESSCGKVCAKPLFTGCEHLQMAATRRARALGPEGRSVRIPRCNTQGDFDPIQCDNEIVGSCWCVDEAGFELAGTRAPAKGLVNCSAPAACAAHTCRMLCPHGFKIAPDGCPVCQCRDPCSDIRCPNSLTCQLEEVACLKQPCPPIPTCKKGRSLENICPIGEPLMITDSHRPFLCGTDPGKPNCPPLYQCLVQRGNDYGVCCPASIKIQKPGMCPAPRNVTSGMMDIECESPCVHDLECPSMQKCCHSDSCGKHCVFPENLTECLQQKALAEALSINERAGRGYIPQCSEKDGTFENKQCSRNDLVCWCVDRSGYKAKGSMGPKENVDCSKFSGDKGRSTGRSLTGSLCDRNICASICEYGFRVGEDGCPTCECDDPCQGFTCKNDEECVPVKDQSCQEEFCPSYPMCRPKVTYINPCSYDAPLTNETTGDIINCDLNGDDESDCPSTHQCTPVAKTDQAVCCLMDNTMEEEDEDDDYDSKPGFCPFNINQMCNLNDTVNCVTDSECEKSMKCCLTSNCGSICAHPEIPENDDLDFDRSPSMCEYLRDFNEKMEGTHEGMKLALSTPNCFENGSFVPIQCDSNKECWCVDNFGTEIPPTRNDNATLDKCLQLRDKLECLELTCRLGCDYGFVISAENSCPICQCRNPCHDVSCAKGLECQMVDVACDNDYCPPVPACLPQKVGQCPYLVPNAPGSCEYSCQSDAQCGGTMRCCSNGCGTQCIEPILKTACQHQQAIALHKAAENGIPAKQLYVPACRELDGGYEKIQCHHTSGHCWCVDESGTELPGTRSKLPQQPKCQTPSECPKQNCVKTCEHGFMLNDNGCTTCECKDPCADMTCPNEGEICKVVRVQCVTEPCPPVAMCVGGTELSACGGGSDGPARRCGPSEPPCPSSHKCHLSPLAGPSDDPPVCCPKPRSVCFEPKDEGICGYTPTNSTVIRWYFNPEKNQCQEFKYGGCSGNHNNFQTQQICEKVCPVLSQCERLREKNQKAAIRYKKKTFSPKCRVDTGEWEPIQCMPHVEVCWCVNGKGEPLKGSIVRGTQPQCNFRQARRRMDSSTSATDDVLEELVRQMTAYSFIDSVEEIDAVENNQLVSQKSAMKIKSRCLSTKEQLLGSSASYEVTCDSNGRFTPTQCESGAENTKCWCVDEAGNQLPGTSTFSKGDNICLPTPIDAVDITLGFYGDFSNEAEEKMKLQVLKDLSNIGAKLKNNEIDIVRDTDVTYIHFEIIGNNKVDIAYYIEEMVKQEALALNPENLNENIKMVADIKKSRFHHKLANPEIKNIADNKIIALQHREILSESTVSVVTTYHTAIIVLAAASAFIISTMSVLIMLYRKKVSSMGKNNSIKAMAFNERFLPCDPPIYVLTKSEKETNPEFTKFSEKPREDE